MRIEDILIGLAEISRTDTQNSHPASGLLKWYNSGNEFSRKQKAYAVDLIWKAKRKPVGKEGKTEFYLYAIDDSVNIKIGHSNDPSKRLKNMQTGCASKLKLLWTLPVGSSRTMAVKAERKLHRFCKRYRKRGEWFSAECLPLILKFQNRENSKSERRAQEEELKIVAEARARI